MNTLREAVHDYLALRRGLGFKLRIARVRLPALIRPARARDNDWRWGENSPSPSPCPSPESRPG